MATIARPAYVSLVFWLLSALCPRLAAAQDTVEFFQGPMISSNRVIGMGGAYIGIAEGGDVVLLNPASLSVRYDYAAHKRLDWDWGFSLLQVFPQEGLDVDLSGQQVYQSALLFEAGLSAKLGRHGIGAHILGNSYELLGGTAVQSVYGLGYAYAARRLPLTLGAVASVGTLSLQTEQAASRNDGRGLLLGALYAPCGASYRAGVTARAPIRAPRSSGQGGPETLLIPGELGLGVSYRIGPNRENPCPSYGEPFAPQPKRAPARPVRSLPASRPASAPAAAPVEAPGSAPSSQGADAATSQPYQAPLQEPALAGVAVDRSRLRRPRRYTLFAADLVLTGRSVGAVGVQSLLDSLDGTGPAPRLQAAGERATLGLRAGVESEVLENRLKLRGGMYYEPSRFDPFSGRVHATAGIDVRAFHLVRDWKLTWVGDFANQYANAGLGIGFWR